MLSCPCLQDVSPLACLYFYNRLRTAKPYVTWLVSNHDRRFISENLGVYICGILLKVFAWTRASPVAGKKTKGLGVLLGVSREPRLRPIRGWVASLFYVKTRGVRRGDFVTLIRDFCQKAVQSQRIYPVAYASQINEVTHRHNTTSRAWGNDWPVISFMGGEGA